MRKWWMYDEVKASFFGLMMMLVIGLEGFFIPEGYTFALLTLGVPIGVSIAILFNRTFYLFIFCGALFGYFFKGEVFLSLALSENIIVAFYKSLLLMALIEIGLRLYKAYIHTFIVSKKYLYALYGFIGFAIALSVLKGVSVFVYCLFSCHHHTSFFSLVSVLIATFSGLLFFTPFIVMGKKETIKINKFKMAQSPFIKALFFVVFITTTLLLISGVFEFTLYRHIYVLLAFYIVASLLYSYYIILALNSLFLLTYGSLSYIINYTSDPWVFLERIVITFGFLTIAIIFSLILKRYVEAHREQNEFLETSNKELNKTFDYIYQFFDLSSDILTQDVTKEHFAKETFKLTNFLFEDTDASFAYFSTQGSIEPVIAWGYDLDNIPFLHALHDSKTMQEKSLVYYKNISESIKKHYPNYVFSDSLQPLKSTTRIYSVFTFEADRLFIVAHDYYKHTSAINTTTLKRIRDYTNLLNRLFKKHYIESQNRLIKRDIILSFVRTLDLYDHYTKGHSEDVAKLSKDIASQVSDDQTFINDIYWAGLLHDIGKLGVEYDVLNKKGKLNDQEYEYIKKHVEYSFDVLNKNEDLKAIANMVSEHHERIDGRGYPKGLNDTDISLGGKIIALCDAVATMATARPYKKKLDEQTIIEEIQKHAGTQFDAVIVEKMVAHIKNGALSTLNS